MKRNSFTKRILAPSPFKIGFMLILISAVIYYNFNGQKPQFLHNFDNNLTDIMFHLRGPKPTTGKVVIVGIDHKSLNHYGQWPWSRNLIAQLTDTINSQKPASITLDMIFAGPDRTSPQNLITEILPQTKYSKTKKELQGLHNNQQFNYDLILGEALSKAPSVLAYPFSLDTNSEGLAVGLPNSSLKISTDPQGLSLAGSGLIVSQGAIVNTPTISVRTKTEGFHNILPDNSGVVRKAPLFMLHKDLAYPSLTVESFRIGKSESEAIIHLVKKSQSYKQEITSVSIGDTHIPTDEKGQLSINYRGPAKTFSYISASSILSGKEDHNLAGKHIIIGISARNLSGMHITPYTNSMPGVEIHATIIDNILASDPLTYDTYTEFSLTLILLIAGGLLLSAILSYAPPLVGGLGGILILITPFAASYVLFLQNRVVGITYPITSLTIVYLGVGLFKLFFAGQEKRFLRGTFKRYVSPGIIKKIVRDPDSLSLKGEMKELTVFFSDIHNFTAISDRLSPDKLHLFMNEYLTAMSNLIIEKDGMVDKYMGDAIMAIWGAPLPIENPEIKAVQTAFKSLTTLKELQGGAWRRKGLPKVGIAIGINTGKMKIGNFGCEMRFDYTVIGDNVKLASRLEGLNKTYGTNILISERTHLAIKKKIPCRYIDSIRFKEKGTAIKIYEPLEVEDFKALRTEIGYFEKALEVYQQRKFKQAHILFTTLNTRNPQKLYDIYIERSAFFSLSPPASDWDGSFSLVGK